MKHLEETVKLLTHLEANPEATQRELVAKLDVSLGKVNFIVNALVDRGVIKLDVSRALRTRMGTFASLLQRASQRRRR